MKEKCTKQKRRRKVEKQLQTKTREAHDRIQRDNDVCKSVLQFDFQVLCTEIVCVRVITVFYRKNGKKKEVGKISKNNDEY